MSGSVGWYGKLPSAGDFLGRRLPAEFQEPWDRWLQQGISHSRRSRGAAWLDAYLTFPVWRFLLPAGWLGESGWCGVLMPSVDRVERCFPLTICERLPPDDGGLTLRTVEARLDIFAQAGLDALDGLAVDELDRRLASLQSLAALAPNARLAPIATPDPNAHASPTGARIAGEAANTPSRDAPVLSIEDIAGAAAPLCRALTEPLAQALAHAAERALLVTLRDRALWWFPASVDSRGELRLVPVPLGAGVFDELIRAPMPASS